MTQSKQCTCASFFTVRGVHKKDCPLFTEPHCNCSHFQTQIINHGAGSYTTRFTWQCPIHGTLHKDFEAPEGFAPSKHERGQAIKHHLNRLSNNTYTCEHGNESWDCSKCIRKALTRPTTDTAERNCCPNWSSCNQNPECPCRKFPNPECHCPDCKQVPNNYTQFSPTTDTSDWRERFDDHFFVHPNGVFRNGKILHPEYFPLTIETVKAFIEKEIERARQIEHCDEPACPECAVAAYEAGLKKGREEGFDAGGKTVGGTGRTMYEAGRAAAFAEVKELLKDALTLEPRDGDTWKRGYYDAVIFMIELTDKQV